MSRWVCAHVLPRDPHIPADLQLFPLPLMTLSSHVMATMQFEPRVKSENSFFSHPVTLPPLEQSYPTTSAEGPAPATTDGLPRGSLTPPAGQPVFERIPSSKITRSRRIVITTLLVLANLVQVSIQPLREF
jgi:hypothetical protein